MKTVNEKLNM